MCNDLFKIFCDLVSGLSDAESIEPELLELHQKMLEQTVQYQYL